MHGLEKWTGVPAIPIGKGKNVVFIVFQAGHAAYKETGEAPINEKLP